MFCWDSLSGSGFNDLYPEPRLPKATSSTDPINTAKYLLLLLQLTTFFTDPT